MTIQFNSSVIITEQVDVLADFYREVLQQEVTSDFGACLLFSCGLSIWKPAAEHVVRGHLQREPGTARPFELCFETDDFDGARSRLKQNRVRFLHDTLLESWGQYVVRFFDPDGNLVEVGESIPCFVKRLHREGLSIDEVAQKTSVPIDTVKQICRG
jgi:catechol 2,3-dioxygenase-like lactoylglutathione lyase family enzyme